MASEESRKAAAASIAARYNIPTDMKFLREIIAGENDDHPAVQAFEAFRAQIVERCAVIAESNDAFPQEGAAIAAAIRSADHG